MAVNEEATMGCVVVVGCLLVAGPVVLSIPFLAVGLVLRVFGVL